MDTVASIFDRYEAVRHRLHRAETGATTAERDSLLDTADEADAFVFDAFGGVPPLKWSDLRVQMSPIGLDPASGPAVMRPSGLVSVELA